MNHFNSYSEDKRALLSTLWLFVLINVLLSNMHELLHPSVPALQIVMVVLSRMLPDEINRWANLVVAVLSVIFIMTVEHQGMGNVFFAAAQITGLIAIIWVALSQIRLEELINFIDMPTRP